MTNTIRKKLLIVFLCISGISIATSLLINSAFFYKKQKLTDIQGEIAQINHDFLEAKNIVSTYFASQLSDTLYFKTGKSGNGRQFGSQVNIILLKLRKLSRLIDYEKFQLTESTDSLIEKISGYKALFDSIQTLVKIRGFKDYGCEGQMRHYIHQLEKLPEINKADILYLRRHEKDYFMRHDKQYVDLLLQKAKKFEKKVLENQQISIEKKLIVKFHLGRYLLLFGRIVELEGRIGLHGTSGLYKKLIASSGEISEALGLLEKRIKERNAHIYSLAQYYYIAFIALLLASSIAFSIVFSRIITKPVTALSQYVSDFIKNGFSFSKEMTLTAQQDEIGQLAFNFKILRDEIVDHLYNLKQKVEERTFKLMEQKCMIERQNSCIEKQMKALEQMNKKLEKQKSLVFEQNQSIISSIRYAKQIQESLLPEKGTIKKHFPESFVMFQPKDIVSGDFYWFEKTQNGDKVIFTIADCTGHGVPGAFMSFLGHTSMNQAVKEKGLTSPESILMFLDKYVHETLRNNTGKKQTIKDGMDMSVCEYDLITKKLSYSAAFTPLYIVRDGALIEYKPDKIVIGKLEGNIKNGNKNFSRNLIQLQKGDKVYLSTDGFSDQFGGPKGKKFKRSYFKALLKSMYHLTMQEQYDTLIETFHIWKGQEEQVDDVLIFGFEVL